MEWVKIRASLPNHPKVGQLAALLDASKMEVVGLLVVFWSWVESQTHNGHIQYATPALIDSVVGRVNFAKAMSQVCWLTLDAKGVYIPHFGRYMGRATKRRAQDARRKHDDKMQQEAK